MKQRTLYLIMLCAMPFGLYAQGNDNVSELTVPALYKRYFPLAKVQDGRLLIPQKFGIEVAQEANEILAKNPDKYALLTGSIDDVRMAAPKWNQFTSMSVGNFGPQRAKHMRELAISQNGDPDRLVANPFEINEQKKESNGFYRYVIVEFLTRTELLQRLKKDRQTKIDEQKRCWATVAFLALNAETNDELDSLQVTIEKKYTWTERDLRVSCTAGDTVELEAGDYIAIETDSAAAKEEFSVLGSENKPVEQVRVGAKLSGKIKVYKNEPRENADEVATWNWTSRPPILLEGAYWITFKRRGYATLWKEGQVEAGKDVMFTARMYERHRVPSPLIPEVRERRFDLSIASNWMNQKSESVFGGEIGFRAMLASKVTFAASAGKVDSLTLLSGGLGYHFGIFTPEALMRFRRIPSADSTVGANIIAPAISLTIEFTKSPVRPFLKIGREFPYLMKDNGYEIYTASNPNDPYKPSVGKRRIPGTGTKNFAEPNWFANLGININLTPGI